MPPVWAARWNTIWQPFTARRACSNSRRSQSRLRGTTMSAGSTPRAVTRCSTTKEPMKPAPPVIRIFFPAKKSVTRGGLPVDPGGPALAMLGVPLDALAHALLPRVLGRPPGELVELAVIDAQLLDLALAQARPPFRVGLELLRAPVAELLAGPDDELVPVEDRDGSAVAVHVDVAGRAEEGGVDVAAHAVLHEAVLVAHLLADVAVLLRGARGVDLIDVHVEVDDGLQQVHHTQHVRAERLVRAVPALADVRLGAEVEDHRLVAEGLEDLERLEDRLLVREVGAVDRRLLLDVTGVVEHAGRRRAHEHVDVGVVGQQRLDQVRSHEAVAARHEDGASLQQRGDAVLVDSSHDALPRVFIGSSGAATAGGADGTDYAPMTWTGISRFRGPSNSAKKIEWERPSVSSPLLRPTAVEGPGSAELKCGWGFPRFAAE